MSQSTRTSTCRCLRLLSSKPGPNGARCDCVVRTRLRTNRRASSLHCVAPPPRRAAGPSPLHRSRQSPMRVMRSHSSCGCAELIMARTLMIFRQVSSLNAPSQGARSGGVMAPVL
eukprot:5990654-Pleurochrysis_carterae.AAC.2